MSEETPGKALAPNIKTREDDRRGGSPPGQRGNAAFVPTEQQRNLVRELAKVTHPMNQQAIANRLGISRMTLDRHFAKEIEHGRGELAIALGTQAINLAMNAGALDADGNPLSKGDPDMLKFVLTRMCGWTQKVEVTGKDGGPVQSVDFSRFSEEQLIQYAKLAAAQRGILLNDDGEEVGVLDPDA